MFRIQLLCSCSVELIPGNLPLFMASGSCNVEHSRLNPYIGSVVRNVQNVGNMDVLVDSLMSPEYEGEDIPDELWH